MGRELKRVALDFDWPIKKTWDGFLNPYCDKCPNENCENGYTGARRWLQSVTHLLMMLGEAGTRKGRPIHPWLAEMPLRPGVEVDASASDLTSGLAGRKPMGFGGHDACDNWSAERKIIKAAGLNPKTWGICPTCKGEAMDPKTKRKRDSWKEKAPPKGDGYQLWETTSEGSPISPVFKTIEELCIYAAENCTTFGSHKASAEDWRKMLDENFVRHQEGNMVFI